MKSSTITVLFTLALLVAACNRMQDIGGADGGSDADADSDTDADSDADSDGDYDVFGYVSLVQRTTDVDEGGFLTLLAVPAGDAPDRYGVGYTFVARSSAGPGPDTQHAPGFKVKDEG